MFLIDWLIGCFKQLHGKLRSVIRLFFFLTYALRVEIWGGFKINFLWCATLFLSYWLTSFYFSSSLRAWELKQSSSILATQTIMTCLVIIRDFFLLFHLFTFVFFTRLESTLYFLYYRQIWTVMPLYQLEDHITIFMYILLFLMNSITN